MFRKLLIGAAIMLTGYFTGCITGRYGIPHHTAYQISQYQHLYTATEKSVKRKLISANLAKDQFVVGEIAFLGTPEIERGGVIRTIRTSCGLNVYFSDVSISTKIVDVPIGILFRYPEPEDHHISVGDLIVVKLDRHIPNRRSVLFHADFVRNLSMDWRTYKLPLTK